VGIKPDLKQVQIAKECSRAVHGAGAQDALAMQRQKKKGIAGSTAHNKRQGGSVGKKR